jgi:hypothetical protein
MHAILMIVRMTCSIEEVGGINLVYMDSDIDYFV